MDLCKKCVLEESLSSQLGNIKIQEDTFGQGIPMQEFIADCQKKSYTSEQLSELVTSLNSSNLYRQHYGVIGIRKLISNGNYLSYWISLFTFIRKQSSNPANNRCWSDS